MLLYEMKKVLTKTVNKIALLILAAAGKRSVGGICDRRSASENDPGK